MSKSANRQQAMMEMMFKIFADASQAITALNAFQKQTVNSINKTNQLVGSSNSKLTKDSQKAAQKAQMEMKKIMGAPFVAGGGAGGTRKSLDDYILKQQQMRGVTSGLRHEVGKLRNTLLLFVFATTVIVSAFKQWFQAVIQAEAALVGLKSVAISTGQSFEVLKRISLEMEQKGFLSLGGGAAALKNLAASNLTMIESVKVLKALTDAAAFNRQGTLSMEEAIVGATQGIKNQNSIMIDNAGITKNVSVMYREFASTIGKTAGSLTEAEKRQAIVNGILKEAALFAGNAEKSLSSYQGRLTKFQTTMVQVQRDLGQLIVDPLVNTFGDMITSFQKLSKAGIGKDLIEDLVESVNYAIKSILTLTEIIVDAISVISSMLKGVESIVSNLSGGFIQLGKWGGLLLKTGGLLWALGRINTYFSSLLTNVRSNVLEKSFKINLSQQLKEAIIAERGYQVLKRGSVQSSIQQARIESEIAVHLKDGNAQMFIKEAFQKRINFLLGFAVRTKTQELELEAKIQTLRGLGFEGVEKAGTSRLRGPKGRFIAGKGPTVIWNEGGTSDLKKGEELKHTALLGDATRTNLTLFGRFKFELKSIGQEFKNLSLLSARFWDINKAGATAATRMTLTWGTTLRSIGRSVLSMGALLGNVLLKSFMWVTLIITAFQIIKDLFAEQKADHSGLVREIGLELKGLEGIRNNHREIVSLLASRQEFFSVKGGKEFLDITGKSGRSLRILSSGISEVASKLKGYEYQLKSMQDIMSKGGQVNDEYFRQIQEYVEDLKTEYNSLKIEIEEVNDKINQSQEFVIEQLDNWGDMTTGTFNNMIKKTSELFKSLQAINTNMPYLLRMPIENIDEQKAFDATNRYQQMINLAYRSHYRELEKIIRDGEEKISKIRQEALTIQLSTLRNSLVKQVTEIENSFQDMKTTIENELSKIEMEKLSMTFEVDLQKALLEFQRGRAEAEKFQNTLIAGGQKAEYLTLKNVEYSKALDDVTNQIVYYENVLSRLAGRTNDAAAAYRSGIEISLEEAKKLKKSLLDLGNSTSVFDDFESKSKKLFNAKGEFTGTQADIEALNIQLQSLSKTLGDESWKTVIEPKVNLEYFRKAFDGGSFYELQDLMIKPETLDLTPYTKQVNNVRSGILSIGTAWLSTLSQITASQGFLLQVPKNIEKLNEVLGTAENNLNSMAGALNDKLGASFESTNEKLNQFREDQLDLFWDFRNLNDALALTEHSMNTNLIATKNLSESYIDATGNLKLFGAEYYDFQKDIIKNSQASADAQEKLFRYFNESIAKIEETISKTKDPGIIASLNKNIEYLKELKLEITEVFGKKLEILNIVTGLNRVGSEIDKIRTKTLELADAFDALNEVSSVQSLDFLLGWKKAVREVEITVGIIESTNERIKSLSLDEIQEAGLINFNYDEALKQAKEGLNNYLDEYKNTLNKKLKEVNEEIEIGTSAQVNIAEIFGFDFSGITKIEKWRDSTLKAIDTLIAIFPELTAVLQGVKAEIDLLAQAEIKVEIKGNVEEMINKLSDSLFNFGKLYKETEYKVQATQEEQRKAVKEQTDLYNQGLITAEEKMRRVAQINGYYAQVIDNIWSEIGNSVLQSITEMGKDIITQLVQQIAVAKAMESVTAGAGGFSSMLSGLTAFLPFAPIILGLGMLSSAISNVPELEAPTFDDTTQNQLTKFGGTIRAEEVNINITPTFIIEGQQIFIGSGSVVEYVEEATELMKEGVQQAIDNQEFSFDSIRALK